MLERGSEEQECSLEEKRSSSRVGYMEAILACLLYGGNTIAGRLVAPQVPPAALSMIRGMLGLLVLAPFLWQKRKIVRLEKGDIWRLGLLGLMGISCAYITFAWALKNTTAVNAAIIFATFPAVTLALLALFWRVRPKASQMGGVVIAFVGLLLVILKGSLTRLLTLSFHPADGLLLLNVLAVALNNIWGQSLMRRYPPLIVAGYSLLFGTLGLLPWGLWEMVSYGWHLSFTGWLLVLYMGLIISGCGVLLNFEAVHRIGSGPVAIFNNLNPIFAIILAALLLKEPLFPYHVVGIFLVLTGVTLSLWADLTQDEKYQAKRSSRRHPCPKRSCCEG
ncbi:Permease of the drug/metabolite transporter (DMT) superfamily [Thermanaeromonas toyohensis ToBE]|uniref:Permease of the drug/metabolite transporter (DMT) superfamily n=1 Tax=Thermanaeromonas toyohensis ToBE TaxID=698762 RepID=A0A1W1W1P5_9FIRM|nr:DMT family transporter [Thermanaeromonas toyohensis]SMB99547.1 Permease of the drug/metabolite transporter (DMT) superfamily [Thermanaeromonas toyohensis ToBE]